MVDSNAKPSAFLRLSAVVVVAVLVGAAVLVNRYVTASTESQHVAQASPAATVRVARVERRTVVRRTEFHGFLAPFEALSISADVIGEIVEQHVEVSSAVTRGQLLYKIDDAVRRIKHEEAIASLDRAKSEHALAEAQWDRVRGLTGEQTTSIENKQAESDFLSTGAIQRQAKTVVDLAALLLERTAVTSPIDGVVSDVFQRRGEHAQPGSPLVRVIDVARLRLVVQVDDNSVVWVKIGQRATVSTETFPGEVFEGTVYRIHPQALHGNRKFEIEILLSNADRRLQPGFFMQGTIVETAANDPAKPPSSVLLVPREAVVEQFGASFCYVVTEAESASADQASEMVATRTAVHVLPNHATPRFLRAASGLAEGDRVVTKGLTFLSDQTRVIITD